MMSQAHVIREDQQIGRLWIHEANRVFGDRLVNDKDRGSFHSMTIELAQRYFKGKFDKEDIYIKNKILFTDIMRLDAGVKDYEEVHDYKKLLKILADRLDDYNSDDSTQNKMALVFFEQCVEHLLRILRVLRTIRGNLMLIGVGGSGKQSLNKLASFILEYSSQQIEITKGYGSEDFHEFLCKIMALTGVEGKGVVFQFTDTQILKESFLEDINNILNSGEVPNLWKQEDKDNVLNDMRNVNARLKRPTDPDSLYKTFVERVRNNLHIVLCMSPIGDALRVRCRQFPALVDCCTLDWFSSWPQEALYNVAVELIKEDENFPQSTLIPDRNLMIEKIATLCKEVHQQSQVEADKFEMALKRKIYNTPKSYLDLIKLYLQTLQNQRDNVLTTQRRLSSGLTKLEQANKQVASLQITLTELQPQLEEQNKAVEHALKQVEKDTIVASQKEAIVSEETEKVQKQKDKIQLIVDDAQYELDKVMPELIKAQEAVEKIDKAQLISLRSMPNPPGVVLMVFEGVTALLGTKSDWATVKGLLLDLGKFIQSLIDYDKENIPAARLKKLNAVLAKPEFDIPQIQQKVSYAADLAIFCKAMKIYADTNTKVKPKKEQVAKLQAELDIANEALEKQMFELNKVKASVQKLKDETTLMQNKKQQLEEDMSLTEARLERAKKLISLTGDEAKRWEETCLTLNEQVEKLFGDVLLSCAQISYQSPFTGTYRKDMTLSWSNLIEELQIPKSENYSILKTLGDPMQLRDWVIKGLPSDTVSQENSIFVSQGYRWPLMIDPQLQANRWIKNMESTNLQIVKFTNSNFISLMSNAISNGTSIMIEDVDETLDPSIDTVLAKAFYESEGRVLIRFADSDIMFHRDFRLYMNTKKPNPNYLPEIFIKVTVVNFTATFEGLEDQLLADVVKNERPEVEQQKDDNVKNLASFRKKIVDSEKNILRLLAEANAEKILDDITLITTLEFSKNTAIEIEIQLQESEILEKEIDQIRNSYRKVSIRGSILYFVIKDLSLLDPMYQYSLQYIQKLFNVAMTLAEKSDLHEERLEFLINKINEVIFVNVCRGLFEKDKLIFSFLIATSINRNSQILGEGLWSIFLRGAGVFDKNKQAPNPDKKLITPLSWDLAHYLDISFDRFKGITKHITNKIKLWKDYASSSDPVQAKLPEEWNEQGIFEKILILKIFRPEKVMFAVSHYVEHYLSKFYLDPPAATMQKVHQDSDFKTPIIFVLSQGADPTTKVLNFTKDCQMEDKLKTISLGQGQGEKAKLLIMEGLKEGNWVFLQNCHLARRWMPHLEVIIDNLREMDENSPEVNKDFRIFLTSMPAPYFPISVLQNGIKLTTEPPRGLKANLKRSWNQFDQNFLDSTKKEEIRPVFHKLVWGLSYFHAIIQERRKFGPLGWNIRYEFNDSDLETTTTVMKMLLEEQQEIPWDSMLFISGHINYGGRVTDDWDRRCLITLLKKFYTTEILKENYKFSDSPTYFVPPVADIENYRKFIEELPLHEDPAVFGLNENANFTYQQQESNTLIQNILSIQPKSTSSASGKSNDQIVLEQVEFIQDQIPLNLRKEDGNKELFEVNEFGLIPSLSTVLLQEMIRFNRLLDQIRQSLKHLKLAIEGMMVMSETLDATYFSLLNNQVPVLWNKVAYPSLKPLAAWTTDLIERVQFMNDWLINNNPNSYWISGFFFPQGFMTGVLQTHARKYLTAIDQLDFSFKIQEFDKDQCVAKPPDGVYIYGLFLEGALYDRKKKSIVDQTPGSTYCVMPIIHFNPIEQYKRKEDQYACPVYKTSTRAGVLSTTGQSTNFILAVDIPSLEQTPDFWILRGSALLCQLNE